jgi:hypothetical protein
MPISRRPSRRATGPLAAALALLTLAAAGAAAAPAGATTRPSTLLSKALRDATHAKWVHEVIATTTEGHSVSMTNAIGTAAGHQVIVADGHHAAVLVLGGTAFIEGDAKALAGYFGIPADDISKLAGKWMSVPPSDAEYQTVSAAVTLASDFDNLGLSGHLKEGSMVTVDGQRAIPITGTFSAGSAKVPATMYVTTGAAPLPIEFKASGHGLKSITRWSDWGHGVTLTVPSDAIPAADLGL